MALHEAYAAGAVG